MRSRLSRPVGTAGVIHVPRSQKKRIGLVGIYVQRRKAPRLIGWVYPPAGLDGRRELAASLQKRCKGYSLRAIIVNATIGLRKTMQLCGSMRN